jgi:predicted N-acyltransferase
MTGIRFLDSLGGIPAADWDALVPDGNPFVSHAFLSGMEAKGCLREDYGWKPYHLGIFDSHDRLVAASPTYLKGNSHGEFVFDWSWAAAWERAGGDYYPKMLVASPYSPVPGPRLLVREGIEAEILRNRLTSALVDEADRLGLSSIHANFLADTDLDAFDDRWLVRADYQFHWHNQGYADFDAFLASLKAKKRKNIRQERAHAMDSGLRMEMRGGDELSDAEWRQIHALYELTFDMKGNHAALTARFFQYLGRTLGPKVQVAMARDVEVSGLHFELCYYRGIDYAIREGIARFEPGAQGEHKLARGFLPTLTHSRHYIAHDGFRQAVASALEQEAQHREAYRDELLAHSPYADR